jgi:hypothetical protein
LEKSPNWVPRGGREGAPKRVQGGPGRGKGKERRNQIMGATKATGGLGISPKGGPEWGVGPVKTLNRGPQIESMGACEGVPKAA